MTFLRIIFAYQYSFFRRWSRHRLSNLIRSFLLRLFNIIYSIFFNLNSIILFLSRSLLVFIYLALTMRLTCGIKCQWKNKMYIFHITSFRILFSSSESDSTSISTACSAAALAAAS